jgi:hypothetical protein
MRPKKYRPSSNKQLERTVRSIDELARFDEFKQTVLPVLLQDLHSGLSADEIIAKYAAIAAARIVTEVASPEKGLIAAKDIVDRHVGKAVERKQVDHRLAQVDEQQVDALIHAKLAALEGEDE